jgi:hypothetical protein
MPQSQPQILGIGNLAADTGDTGSLERIAGHFGTIRPFTQGITRHGKVDGMGLARRSWN